MLATDDIAFDLYQDIEVAKIIRRLEQQKTEAVESLTPFLSVIFTTENNIKNISGINYKLPKE